MYDDFGVFQRADRLDDMEFRPEFSESSKVDWVRRSPDPPAHLLDLNDLGPIQSGESIVEGAFLRFTEVLEEQFKKRE